MSKDRNARTLWGVQHKFDWGWGLLYGSWHEAMRMRSDYDGEPSRPVLFRTRAQARAWCAQEHEKYKAYKGDGICEHWRFRAVRVVERLEAQG